MPARRAPSGEEKCTGSPPNMMRPEVGVWTPEIHLIRVDFPAPLSPTIAVISPLRAQMVTSLTAWTAPNHFLTLSTSRRTSLALGIVAPSDVSFDTADAGGLSAEGGVKGSVGFIVGTSQAGPRAQPRCRRPAAGRTREPTRGSAR